ncbi:MAG: sugar ABC transporter substrate-binding protein [Spirochaetales bacterium]|nr:sugar ABC transporter substrate-binding protein [Spirochaetales bacterium]
MLRKLLVVLLSLTALSGIYANGSQDSGHSNNMVKGEKIDLTVESGQIELDVFLPFGSDFHNGRLTDFKAANPNISIREVEIAGNFDTKLITMAAAGNAPDVFVMGPQNILTFIRHGVLLPLDDYFESSEVVKRTDLLPINEEVFGWSEDGFGEGSIYGFASGWSPDLFMYYNRDLFDKAGVEYPSSDKPMTWSQFRAMLQKLGEKDSSGNWLTYPTVFDFVPIQHLYSYILSNGGSVYTKDGGTCVVADDSRTREAIQAWMDMQIGPDAVIPYFEDPIPQQSSQMFQSGRMAVAFGGSWAVKQYWDKAPGLNWGYAPTPVADNGGENVAMVAGMIGQVISARTRYPNAAWKLFEYLLTEDQQWVAESGMAMPIRRNYLSEMGSDPTLNDHMKSFVKFLGREAETARLFPRSPYIPDTAVDTIFRDNLREVYFGNMNLDAALQKIQTEVNTEIGDWK